MGRLDLNLLLILDALSEERSVTAVARRLRISQPTVSFSLNKLRDFFQDELFVRHGTKMQATPFVETIHEPVRRIIETINQEILRDHNFDPLTSERTFCISTSDIGEMVFLPDMLKTLRGAAPRTCVRCLSMPPVELQAAMANGLVDIALGYFPDLIGAGFYQQKLFEHPFACLDDRFHETGSHGTGDSFVDSSFVFDRTRSDIMARWRQAVELGMTDEEIGTLAAIARSRSEAARRVERAQILLTYRENPSFFAVGQRLGVHHQTVQRCVERAMAYGPLAALDDRPRPGKEPTITPEAKAWLVSLACEKAKEHGYPHELWTTRLLARHARDNAPAAGHESLANLVQGTVCKILAQEEVKPHKVRYYLERRDAEFEQKMAEVLCVYREVQVLKKAAKAKKPGKPVAIVSYDEKPGIQAIATTAPDLPPVPGVHATFARDHEYKRHGTLSLLAGIDLLTGKVHALVRDRHRSREFIEFLKLLDATYPTSTAIKLILDNHSAHISRETTTWLATRPAGRFEFTFTPKHGSWLNLIEGFFSKFARSVLRHIRVASKQELKERITAGIKDVNRYPVIHTWSYKLAEAA
jgi:DNA-binding transcriptional LysR family regulator/transposase